MTRSPETVKVEWLRDGNLMSESAYGGRISFHDNTKEKSFGLKIFQTKVSFLLLVVKINHFKLKLSNSLLNVIMITVYPSISTKFFDFHLIES